MSDTLDAVLDARRSEDSAARPDGELAARVAGRPGAAAAEEAELYRRFAKRVRLYGLKHLRDPAAADDLVQHVMLTVIRKLRDGAVREPERIGSFVLGVARLASRERQRERSRWRDDPEQLEAALDGMVEQAPGEARAALDGEALRACLQALGGRERAVVLASFYAERTAREIGEELGLEPGNVRVIRHRAVRSLRDCLQGGERGERGERGAQP